MRKLALIFRILLIPGLLLGLYACGEKDCTSGTLEPELKISFRTTIGSKPPTTPERDTSILFTRIIGRSGNTELTFRPTTASKLISLSLPKKEDRVEFIFERQYKKGFVISRGDTLNKDVTIFDTLSISYTRQPYFISQACGFKMRYSELKIDKDSSDKNKSTFDNSTIEKDNIDLTTPVNIKLYFDTALKPE
jgi:hypothetical protein